MNKREEIYEQFGETDDSLYEEYIEHICNFAENAITECLSRVSDECISDCTKCIRNMYDDFNVSRETLNLHDKYEDKILTDD